MARVRFEPSGYETEMAPGAAFIDLTDEHPEAEVPYSCRSASCGTCRVQVKQGAEAGASAAKEAAEKGAQAAREAAGGVGRRWYAGNASR